MIDNLLSIKTRYDARMFINEMIMFDESSVRELKRCIHKRHNQLSRDDQSKLKFFQKRLTVLYSFKALTRGTPRIHSDKIAEIDYDHFNLISKHYLASVCIISDIAFLLFGMTYKPWWGYDPRC